MLRVLVLCLAALPILAQQADLSLSGIVINSKTGEPIKRAMVTIRRIPSAEEFQRPAQAAGDTQQQLTRNSFSDSGGEFHFTGLPAGRYNVTAQKPEFTLELNPQKPFQFQSVDLSGTTSGIRVSLSPLGVISGKIVDQDGLPIPGVNVVCLTVQIQDGQMQARQDRSVATDDRGVYRFWGLQPGRYFVKATGHGGGTAQTLGDANGFIGDEAFAPVYFGGGNTLASTKPIEIAPGADIQADFAVKFEPAFRVSGTIANFVPRHTASFELRTGNDDVSAIRASVNAESGRFQVTTPIVPGAYVLKATQDETVAETPFVVRGGDVGEVALVLSPLVDIPVETRFAGTAPAQQDLAIEGPPQGNCSARLLRAGALAPAETMAMLNRNARRMRGNNSIVGIAPGRYRVLVSCFGGYARSIVSGTHDFAVDPILTVEPGVTPAPVEILAAYGGGSIQGKIVSPADAPNGLTVLLAPQFASPMGPQTTLSFILPGAQAHQFQFANLAPGSYTLYAFARSDIEFRNPEFLSKLSGGVTVQIDGDDKKEVTLDGVIQ